MVATENLFSKTKKNTHRENLIFSCTQDVGFIYIVCVIVKDNENNGRE